MFGYGRMFGYRNREKPGIDLKGFELLFADSFEREGTLPEILFSDGAGAAGSLTGWDDGDDTWMRGENGIWLNETEEAWYFKTKNIGTSDCIIKARLTVSDHSEIGLCFRSNPDAGNLWILNFEYDYLELRKVQSWSASTVDTFWFSDSPDGEFDVEVKLNGTSIEVYVNGEVVVGATDSFGQSNTFHGLFSTGTEPNDLWNDIVMTTYEENILDIPGENWTAEYPNHAHSVSISESIYSTGSRSLRMELRRTDNEVSDSKCCELAGEAEMPNEEHWYFIDIFLPGEGDEEYLYDPAPEILVQWHNVPDDGEPRTVPPLALWTMDGRYYINRRWDEDPLTSDEKMESEGKTAWHDLGSYLLDKGRWTQWAFHVKWGWLESQEPILEVYKNGKRVLNCNDIPNMINDQSGIYWKIGIYKWDWAEAESESEIDTRVVYYDNVKNYLKTS